LLVVDHHEHLDGVPFPPVLTVSCEITIDLPERYSYSTIFILKIFADIRSGRPLSLSEDCAFKPTKKLSHDSLGLLNKFITSGHCGFPLANPQKGPSLHFVPQSNIRNHKKSFHICFSNR